MQMEEATRGATNPPPNKGTRAKSLRNKFPSRNTPSHSSAMVHKPPRHMHELSKDDAAEANLIPFLLSIDDVFNAINDQRRVRRPIRPLLQNPKGPGSRQYCAFHDGMGHPTVECRTLHDTSKTWLIKDISESCLRRLRNKGSPHKMSRLAAPSCSIER